MQITLNNYLKFKLLLRKRAIIPLQVLDLCIKAEPKLRTSYSAKL
jgi:hypothetical protein